MSKPESPERATARRLAWGSAVLFSCAGNVTMILFAVSTPGILEELHLTEAQLGTLSGAFLIMFAIGQLAGGSLLGRYPVQLILGSAALLSGAGCILYALSQSLAVAVTARLLLGLGLSVNFVGLIHVVSRDYPERFSFVTAASRSITGLAGTCVALIAGFTLILSAFRLPHLIMGATFVVVAVVLFLFVGKKEAEAPTVADQTETAPIRTVLEACYRSREFWVVLVYYTGITGAIVAYSGLWTLRFEMDYFHGTVQRGALMNAVLAVGIAAGSLLAGIWSQRRGDHVLPIRIYALFGVFLFAVMFLFALNVPLALIANFLIGFALAGSILGFSALQKHLPEYAHATATAIVATSALVVGGSLQPLIGDLVAAPVHAHGLLSSYIVDNPDIGVDIAFNPGFATYQKGLSPVAIAVVVGFAASLFLTPGRAKKPS